MQRQGGELADSALPAQCTNAVHAITVIFGENIAAFRKHLSAITTQKATVTQKPWHMV